MGQLRSMDPTVDAVSPAPRSRDRSRVARAVALAAALALSATLFAVVRTWEDRLATSEFERRAADAVTALQVRVDASLEVVRSVVDIWTARGDPGRAEFGTFVSRLLARHPEVLAISWAPRVPEAERERHEARGQAEGLWAYTIREPDRAGGVEPAGRRPEYFPVFFLEPPSGAERLWGFDQGSEPRRREALERARDTGALAATTFLSLVRGGGDQVGFLVTAPLYRSGAVVDTLAGRREALVGLVTAAFTVDGFVEPAIGGLAAGGLAVELYDG